MKTSASVRMDEVKLYVGMTIHMDRVFFRVISQ